MSLEVLYEDNHLIAVNKKPSDIVQGDKTGDTTLGEQVAEWLAKKYKKPGKAFIGVTHRIDRPVSGVVLFAKTSKALSRINALFRDNLIQKTYWAVVTQAPVSPEGILHDCLLKNEKNNKSFVVHGKSAAKEAITTYRLLGESNRYYLLEVKPQTGRHHQIRVQLSHIGCFIKGDLKYGAKRSNADGSIHLHAKAIRFEHPVLKEPLTITAPAPVHDPVWRYFETAFAAHL